MHLCVGGPDWSDQHIPYQGLPGQDRQLCVTSSRPVYRHGSCAAQDPIGRALRDFPVHGSHITVWYPIVPASAAHFHASQASSRAALRDQGQAQMHGVGDMQGLMGGCPEGLLS